jgi:hypothetical protein
MTAKARVTFALALASTTAFAALVACGAFEVADNTPGAIDGAADAGPAGAADGAADGAATLDGPVAPDGAAEGGASAFSKTAPGAAYIACTPTHLYVAVDKAVWQVTRANGQSAQIGEVTDAIGGIDVPGPDYTRIYLTNTSKGIVEWRAIAAFAGSTLLATAQSNPRAVVVASDNYVYYTADAQLFRVLVAGSPQPVRAISGAGIALGVRLGAVNQVAVVAHQGGGMTAYALPAGMAEPSAPGDIRGLALKGTELVFTNAADGTVSIASDVSATPTVIVKGQAGIRGLCRIGQDVFWVRDDGSVWGKTL